MTQTRLFITDIYDALGDLVRALGGPKEVGEAMRAGMDPDAAAGWVKDCLNRNRREKFDPEQIMWLLKKGREIGCHEPIRWLCTHAGYTAPEPKEPETELTRLLREYLDHENRQAALRPQIEEARSKLKLA